MSKHTGPVCIQCGTEFYYDFIPERHDGSGYCWLCFADWELIRARGASSSGGFSHDPTPLPPSHREAT